MTTRKDMETIKAALERSIHLLEIGYNLNGFHGGQIQRNNEALSTINKYLDGKFVMVPVEASGGQKIGKAPNDMSWLYGPDGKPKKKKKGKHNDLRND